MTMRSTVVESQDSAPAMGPLAAGPEQKLQSGSVAARDRQSGLVALARPQLIRASARTSGSTSLCRPLAKRRLYSLSSFTAVNQGVFYNFYIIETAC